MTCSELARHLHLTKLNLTHTSSYAQPRSPCSMQCTNRALSLLLPCVTGDEFLGNIILEFAAQGTLLSFLQKQATIKRPCCNYINCRCQASERNLRTRSGMGRTPQLSLATYCNYADQILEGLKYLRKCQVRESHHGAQHTCYAVNKLATNTVRPRIQLL